MNGNGSIYFEFFGLLKSSEGLDASTGDSVTNGWLIASTGDRSDALWVLPLEEGTTSAILAEACRTILGCAPRLCGT